MSGRVSFVLMAMVLVVLPGCARRARVAYVAPSYGQQAYVQPTYAQPTYAQPAYAQPPPQPQVSAQVQVGGQLIYLPVGGLALSLVQSIVIQSQGGRVFQLGPSDLQPALAGRLALRVPAGVTTGTVTLYAMGQSFSIPFHVAAQMSSDHLIGTAPPPANPACAAIAGRWAGTITDEPGSSSVVDLEILSDCRTVRGFVHLDSPRSGSVDSTLDGTWDPHSYHLVARDTQLFNVVARPGHSFCPTVRYDLQLQSDGTLVGRNQACGLSNVYLYRQ